MAASAPGGRGLSVNGASGEEGAARRFVILAAPRSGSNLLCTLLGSHPEILCHHELFNPRGIFVALPLRGVLDLGTVDERERDPLLLLARAWRTSGAHHCVGFKMTRGQDERVLAHVLADPGVSKIVLMRENRIKTFVSERIAQQLDEWEVYRNEDLTRERPAVSVTLRELREHIALNERYYDELRTALERGGQPWIETRFERLLASAEQRRLLRFLRVTDHQRRLEPASVRQNPADLRRLVTNFEELLTQVRGTALERGLRAADG